MRVHQRLGTCVDSEFIIIISSMVRMFSRVRWSLVMLEDSCISYLELRNALRTLTRNRRNRYQSVNIHQKLLEVCVRFAKNSGRIFSVAVIARLRVALRELKIISPRVRIFNSGEIKALEMQVQYRQRGIFKWVPQLEGWLMNQAYRFWLGTLQMCLRDDPNPNLGSISQDSAN